MSKIIIICISKETAVGIQYLCISGLIETKVFCVFFAPWAYTVCSYIISGAGVVSGTPHPAV